MQLLTLPRKYFVSLGSELKTLIMNIWTVHIKGYNILLDLQCRIPREAGSNFTQEPLILTDALGRVTPIHLELFNTWNVLDSVLEARFKDVPGEGKISHKEYALQDRTSQQDVERTAPFEASFLPDRRIDMTVVFKQQHAFRESCPSCLKESCQDFSKGCTW
jgi:hypothetical protein